jgi:hypothetical protein
MIFQKLAKFCVQKNIQLHVIEKFLLGFHFVFGSFCIFQLAQHYVASTNFFLFYFIILSFEYFLYLIYKKYFLSHYWNEEFKKNQEKLIYYNQQKKEHELALSIHQSKF